MSIRRIGLELVEEIRQDDQVLAIIIRHEHRPDQTAFVTPEDYKQQVGFIVHPQGHEIARHTHRAIERNMVGTSEVVVVRTGRCEVDLYGDDHSLVATRELRTGDVMLMVGGGHGFRMLEDTVFLELKQGPYLGVDEKELF